MKAKVFIFIMFQLSLFNISAQNMEDVLGGVKTHFQLYCDTTNLNPTNQIIIQRAERKSDGDASFGLAWGYGYQSLHLEFVSDKNLAEKKFKFRAGRDNNDKLELTFYDSDNVVLATRLIDFSLVDLLYNSLSDKSLFFYSIDLIDIPIVLLNKTVKMNLTKNIADKNR